MTEDLKATYETIDGLQLRGDYEEKLLLRLSRNMRKVPGTER